MNYLDIVYTSSSCAHVSSFCSLYFSLTKVAQSAVVFRLVYIDSPSVPTCDQTVSLIPPSAERLCLQALVSSLDYTSSCGSFSLILAVRATSGPMYIRPHAQLTSVTIMCAKVKIFFEGTQTLDHGETAALYIETDHFSTQSIFLW